MPAPAKIDVEAIARALGVAPSSISRILRGPEPRERFEREREHLAACASVGVRGHSQIDELDDAGPGARPEAVWLLVRSGSWGFGARRGESVVMRSFPAGLYSDVDEEMIAFVRKAQSPQLVLGTGNPPSSA